MEPIHVTTLIWTWHTFWMFSLTYAVGRAAYRHGGWPIARPGTCIVDGPCRFSILKWPVSGRWLLTALLLMISLMIFDVTRVAWKIMLEDYPTQITWFNVIIRGAPIFIEPWVFIRQIRRGLTNDYQDARRRRLQRKITKRLEEAP